MVIREPLFNTIVDRIGHRVVIIMAQITVEEFRNFFKYYKGEEHQQRAIELFYEDLQHECCEHLDNESAWITQYRTKIRSA